MGQTLPANTTPTSATLTPSDEHDDMIIAGCLICCLAYGFFGGGSVVIGKTSMTRVVVPPRGSGQLVLDVNMVNPFGC